MPEAVLRATDPAGEVYDDPSEDALFEFMSDLRSPEQTLRVERLEVGRQDEWAQVMLNEAGLYAFTSSDHLGTSTPLKTIHEFLTRWAFELFDAP